MPRVISRGLCMTDRTARRVSGATIAPRLLLERTDRVVWALSALAIGSIALGLFAN